MKRLVVTLLALLLMSPAVAMAAQDAPAPDIATVGEQVAAVDNERLLMRLNTPVPADLLPAEFSTPQPLDESLHSEQRSRFDDALEGLHGSVSYTVEYMPASLDASSPVSSESPTASPSARGPVTVFTSGTLTYLLFDTPVDANDMESLGASLQTALGTEAQGGTVEVVTVQDAPAIHISTVTVVNALDFHTEWIALPVGNVVVVAMVTEGSDTFDEQRFREDNESLALAGVAYLQRIVEEMGAA